jgi:pimeloyl-ACP methyl ester carboxylesterase
VQKVTARKSRGKGDFAQTAITENSGNFMDDCELMRLKNGGQLAFCEYGNAAGTPVFFFHGWPSSRTMAELADRAARDLHVRIISPDRPGIRDSSFQEDRKLIDWPDNVQQLADHLDLDRFHVLAVSGGAPYTYATAWKIPERVRAVAIASGAPPIFDLPDNSGLLRLYRRMIWLYRNSPRTLRAFFYLTGALASIRPPPRLRPLMLKILRLRPCDANSLEDTVAFEACFESQRRAWLTSVKGLIHDAEIFGKPWEFRLEDVDVPVRLWHGTEDRAFSVDVAKYVADRIPNCQLRLIEGEGHYSLAIRHMHEILSDLIAL